MISVSSRIENYVLFVATLTSFFTVFLASAVMIAIPTLAGEFGMSNIVQNWVTTIYLLALAIITVPAGQISGKYGLKKTMLIGLIVFTATSAAIMFSTSQDMFLILRIFQGIGAGLITVSSMAMVVSAFKPENRGKALGINIVGVYLGSSLSPVIAGFLNYDFGWRSIFFFTLPFLVLCIVLLLAKVNKEWKTLEHVAIDKKGTMLYSFGMLLFIFGFTTLNQSYGYAVAIIGLFILIAFVFVDKKVKHPVFDVNLFKNVKFASSNVASLCAYFAIFATITIINYHLQYIRGFNSQEAGLLLLIAPACQVVVSPISGRMSDKYNPQKLAAIGAAIAGIGISMIMMLNKGSPLEFLMVALFFIGFGFGLFSSPNTNEIMGSVPKEKTSMASASSSTMRVIGQTMSMGVFTLIFAIIMGNVPIMPSNHHLLILSSQITAAICVTLCFVSVVTSLAGLRSKGYYNG